MRKSENSALCPTNDRSGEVTGRRSLAATWQDEFLESRQVLIEPIQVILEPVDELIGDRAVTRDTKLSTELEQVVLYLGQATAHVCGYRIAGEHKANGAVRLVNRPVGFNAHAVFRCAATVAETRCAVVAGPCVDLAQSITHGATLGRAGNTVKKGACLAAPMQP